MLYDGLCPICVRQVGQFKALCKDPSIHWFDITGQENWLAEHQIDATAAILELHLIDTHGDIIKGLDAFILLWSRTPLFKPLAWLLQLPLIYPLAWRYYHWATRRRLRKQGRLPTRCR